MLKMHELNKIFIKEIFFYDYDVSLNIVLNKDMLFINAY